MNISEANAVNTVVQALAKAYKRLSAGLRPGDVTIGEPA